MHLYVEPMDAWVMEFGADGRVRGADGEWFEPSLQEARAIIYAATTQIEQLQELIDTLDRRAAGGRR